MFKVLYIDSSKDYRKKFSSLLSAIGFQVDVTDSPITGMEYLSKDSYDIAISEIELEDIDGFRFLDSVKNVSPETKQVILTRNDSPDFEIKALNKDIDLYLLKSRGEELAINSLEILKTTIDSNEDNNYIVGEISDLKINLLNHEVLVKDKIIHLTPIEFKILKLLLENSGKFLTREEIIKKVWNDKDVSQTRIVDTHIKKIREKTKCFGIVTVRGYGYMWRD